MRLMSFKLTQRQFLDGSKDVTRRLGWAKLKPGDRLRAVVQAMGLRKGQKVQQLGVIEVVEARREPLKAVDRLDVIREGFPDLSPDQFIAMFCEHMGCDPSDKVTRVEFRRVCPLCDKAAGSPLTSRGVCSWCDNTQGETPDDDEAAELLRHNAEHDRWERMTDRQRDDEIRRAMG